MISNFVIVLYTVTTIFTVIVNAVSLTNTVYATACRRKNNRMKCQFNTTNLNIDTASTIQFVHYDGQLVTCKKNTVKRTKIWYGTCDGDASDVNFVRRNNKQGVPRVYGSIWIGSDICRFGPNAYGNDEMSCKASTEFIEEDDPIDVPADDDYHERTRNLHFGFNPSIPVTYENTTTKQSVRRQSNIHRNLYDDVSGSNIDVMVVWTKEAECKVSKLLPGCTLTSITESNMRGLIDLAVAEGNTAFELSGILSSLRLVYAYRDPTYVEPTVESYKTTLLSLRSVSDGQLDDVHAKRALYGADMVQLISSNPSSCGIAYLSSSKASTFAVINSACATGYYSYVHEIGHNFGMNHDRGTDRACNQTLKFNYGYRSPDASFRSIMSYDCKIGDCDNLPKQGCVRVQRFSNTQFLYNGQPIGSALHDNAKQFNNMRSLIASHYPAMNCNSNIQCNDNDPRTVDTCNTAKAICVFTPISSSIDTTTTTIINNPVPIPVPMTPPTRAPTNILIAGTPHRPPIKRRNRNRNKSLDMTNTTTAITIAEAATISSFDTLTNLTL